jgi:hypothetical protein
MVLINVIIYNVINVSKKKEKKKRAKGVMYFACLKGNISIVYGAFLNLSEYVSEYKHVYLQHYPPNTFLTH